LVWTGYDDNSPIKMTGAQAALPIWARFMKKISTRLPAAKFEAPEGLVTREIDPSTGKLATPSCPNVITEVFIQGTEPLEYCTDADHFQSADLYVANQVQTTEGISAETVADIENTDSQSESTNSIY